MKSDFLPKDKTAILTEGGYSPSKNAYMESVFLTQPVIEFGRSFGNKELLSGSQLIMTLKKWVKPYFNSR